MQLDQAVEPAPEFVETTGEGGEGFLLLEGEQLAARSDLLKCADHRRLVGRNVLHRLRGPKCQEQAYLVVEAEPPVAQGDQVVEEVPARLVLCLCCGGRALHQFIRGRHAVVAVRIRPQQVGRGELGLERALGLDQRRELLQLLAKYRVGVAVGIAHGLEIQFVAGGDREHLRRQALQFGKTLVDLFEFGPARFIGTDGGQLFQFDQQTVDLADLALQGGGILFGLAQQVEPKRRRGFLDQVADRHRFECCRGALFDKGLHLALHRRQAADRAQAQSQNREENKGEPA